MIVPVVLSGGSGSRLWPLSRELYPKQLLPLVGDDTMLQSTVLRLKGIDNLHAPMVVCNEEHRFLVAEQLRQIDQRGGDIILEPCGRNTAPAVAVAALRLLKCGSDPIMLVLPADHVFKSPHMLCEAVKQLIPAVESGHLATFGVVPDQPETGFGYIQANPSNDLIRPVVAFKEKPDRETAEVYLKSGDYYWNSGMFMFKASAFIDELTRLAPEMVAACQQAVDKAAPDLDFIRLDKDSFAACPSDSIDYAVMEKTDKSVVIPLDAGWSDVGSWSALWDIGEHDSGDNVITGDVKALETSGCLLYAEHRLLATVGLQDCIVVETADAVLVAPREQAQNVKGIVKALKSEGRSERLTHRKVSRPWGTYECLDQGERFQVKRICVKPGAILSMQKHHHRAEHWIVVKGTANITRDDEILTLTENQSTFIPVGAKHRLENPGKIPLELIEVQSGGYLGEDDIVRFEDNYGRCQ